MKTSWLLNRLRRMSVAEIAYRVQQKCSGIVERRRVAHGWAPEAGEAVSTRLSMISSGATLPGVSAFDQTLAERLKRGELSLFDYTNLDVGWPVSWHRDPLTGTASPDREYGKAIDYRDDVKVGDIKVLWELGRQQFLVPLALEYSITREPDKLELISGILDSWLSQNPYGLGIHWCSSLEVAIRGMSWSMAHQFLLAGGLEDGLFSLQLDTNALRRQIYQHAYFIRGNLSLYSSANNHLVGELTGLHMLCTVFEFGRLSAEWREFAWDSIKREAVLQVFEDGVNKEQAVYYHCWVLEYLLINYLLAGHNDKTIPEELLSRISRMAQFISDLAVGDLDTPQIGDADDGVAILFSSVASSFGRDLVEAVNVLSGSSEPVDCGVKAACYGLLASGLPGNGIEAVRDTEYPVSYTDGGYAVLGRPEFHVVFDGGPLGYTAIAAHGHADALSLCLAVDAAWWLVDPGTYSYHSEPMWRDYFRGTAAHNTISIGGQHQSEIGGAFMWLRHANISYEGVVSENGRQRVSGWHDGYSGQGVVKHRRTLEVEPGEERIVITDYLDARHECTAEIHFHCAPDVKVEAQEGNRVVLGRRGTSTQIEIRFPEQFSVEQHYGSLDPLLGWYSDTLGKKEPIFTLRATSQCKGSTEFRTRLTLIRQL